MKILPLALTLIALTSCAGIMPPAERTTLAGGIARTHNLTPAILGEQLPLQSYHRPAALKHEHLRVYIEGDGFAYVTSSVPSPDPTPIEPTTLRLAAADEGANVIYMARPCQYTKRSNKACPQKFWTTHRYSREVTSLYNNVLDGLKQEHGIRSFDLVGYSGGGVIAALLAAERDDITALRTVAANLDVSAFTDHHNITPMPHSLNPAEEKGLKSVPQIHYAGEKDNIVPPEVLQSYLVKQGFSREELSVSLYVVQGMNHFSPWYKRWPRLLKEHSLGEK